MIRSYTQSYARAQIRMTAAEIEKQVVADCQMVDNARAAGDIADKPRGKKVKTGRVDRIAEAEHKTGTRLGVNQPNQVVRSKILHANPMETSARWGAAAARIQRILEGVRKDTSSLVVAVEDAELGALATEYADLWGYFMTRYQAPPLSGNDRNPFRGLSGRDAARKFQRLVEDVCDRSTGRLGSWYTK